MKKQEKKELLTLELYNKMSTEKIGKISNLKEDRNKVNSEIKDKSIYLNKILDTKKELEEKIKENREDLDDSKKKKYKLTRQINKETKLVKKLTNIFGKEQPYINLSKFKNIKKTKNKELLTLELYNDMLKEKIEKISSLKEDRSKEIDKLKEIKMFLNELLKTREELEAQTRKAEEDLSDSKNEKHNLTREINSETKLVKKLTNTFKKEEPYIILSKFKKIESKKTR